MEFKLCSIAGKLYKEDQKAIINSVSEYLIFLKAIYAYSCKCHIL